MVSRDRIGVLIGENGRVKDQIERDLNVVLTVDAEAGVVTTKARDDANSLAVLKAKDTITAIARGFPPDLTASILQVFVDSCMGSSFHQHLHAFSCQGDRFIAPDNSDCIFVD